MYVWTQSPTAREVEVRAASLFEPGRSKLGLALMPFQVDDCVCICVRERMGTDGESMMV